MQRSKGARSRLEGVWKQPGGVEMCIAERRPHRRSRASSGTPASHHILNHRPLLISIMYFCLRVRFLLDKGICVLKRFWKHHHRPWGVMEGT